MPAKRSRHKWPFPAQDASPYRRVQLAALRACITDPKLAPDGFNGATARSVGELRARVA
jgi:hypothetical protein